MSESDGGRRSLLGVFGLNRSLFDNELLHAVWRRIGRMNDRLALLANLDRARFQVGGNGPFFCAHSGVARKPTMPHFNRT